MGRTIKIRKGLTLPIEGDLDQSKIFDGPDISSVGVLGPDYVGMRPTMEVSVGDSVKKGQILFWDKKNEGVKFTSPASGRISEINRGLKRSFQSIEIELDGSDSEVQFKSYDTGQLSQLNRVEIIEDMIESGLWTALRTRPYSKVPGPKTTPNSLFINVMETSPLSTDPNLVLKEYKDDFANGVTVLSKLTDGKTFVCHSPDTQLPKLDAPRLETVEFKGPHPSGLVGTHIHFLDSVSAEKTVWHIPYQEVIAVGKLFTTGSLWTERVVAVAGSQIGNPRNLRLRLGANITDVVKNTLKAHTSRIISGSVLSGHRADKPMNFLGRYHFQISAIPEGSPREFLGWQTPGFNKFSVKNAFAAKLIPNKKFNFNTSTNGSPRAMVPVGAYEKVMPLDILPTFLLRSLVMKDTEMAQKLGCLELDEEDLSLCTFVCPGKTDYGPILRDNLTQIEKEG